MKRASYREAVRWVAWNDSGGDLDALRPEIVAELVTSGLVADIFDVPAEKVGRDVVRYRLSEPQWANGPLAQEARLRLKERG